MIKQEIKAILFDFDDTLVMTRHCKNAALKELSLVEFHRELTDEKIELHWGKPYREFIAGLYDIPLDGVDVLLEKYRKASARYPMKVYEGALETLEKLSRDYLLGMVTGTSRYAIEIYFPSLGFRDSWFFHVQTADESPYHKPDPRVFLPQLDILEKRYNILPENCVYVGDGLHDFAAARDAGMGFIGIHGNTTAEERFRKVGAVSISEISLLPSRLEG